MKTKPTIENYVRVDSRGMTREDEVFELMKTQQEATSRQTQIHTADPRIKAQSIIDEIVKTAASCTVSARILKDEADKMAASADRAKTVVFQSADKMSVAMAKLWKSADFERMERMTLLVERMAAAMKILSDLEDKGKLSSICEAMKKS